MLGYEALESRLIRDSQVPALIPFEDRLSLGVGTGLSSTISKTFEGTG